LRSGPLRKPATLKGQGVIVAAPQTMAPDINQIEMKSFLNISNSNLKVMTRTETDTTSQPANMIEAQVNPSITNKR